MPRPSSFQRMIQRLSASRPAAVLLAPTLNHLDRLVARWTRGQTTATQVLAGVPVLSVETIGARTSRTHTVMLLAIPRGKEYVLVATALGSRNNPAWYYNLLAHPAVNVTVDGRTRPFRARVTSGEERQTCWNQAIAVYPGYAAYLRRAERIIPILLLTPVED